MDPRFYSGKKNFILKESDNIQYDSQGNPIAVGLPEDIPPPPSLREGTPEEFKELIKFCGHTGLALVGVFDMWGVADGANCVWYLLEGDYYGAFISFLGAVIPYLFEPIKIACLTLKSTIHIVGVGTARVIFSIVETLGEFIAKFASAIRRAADKFKLSRFDTFRNFGNFIDRIVAKFQDFADGIRFLWQELRKISEPTKVQTIVQQIIKRFTSFFRSSPEKISNLKDQIFTKEVVKNYYNQITQKPWYIHAISALFAGFTVQHELERKFTKSIQQIENEILKLNESIGKEYISASDERDRIIRESESLPSRYDPNYDKKWEEYKKKVEAVNLKFENAKIKFYYFKSIDALYAFEASGRDPEITAIIFYHFNLEDLAGENNLAAILSALVNFGYMTVEQSEKIQLNYDTIKNESQLPDTRWDITKSISEFFQKLDSNRMEAARKTAEFKNRYVISARRAKEIINQARDFVNQQKQNK